jgi:pyruvate-formate lyase
MSENVRECQRMSENVRECQRMSENVRECQRMSRISSQYFCSVTLIPQTINLLCRSFVSTAKSAIQQNESDAAISLLRAIEMLLTCEV